MTFTLTREEKMDMVQSFSWDYDVDPEDMPAVVEGKKAKAGLFDAAGCGRPR